MSQNCVRLTFQKGSPGEKAGMTPPPTDRPDPAVLVLDRIPGRGEASDLIGAALEAGARWVALKAAGLPPGFLVLSTGQAGEFAQKCVNYRIGLAILGDIGPALATSSALRDWVRECNRGDHVWFLNDEAELAARLSQRSSGSEQE